MPSILGCAKYAGCANYTSKYGNMEPKEPNAFLTNLKSKMHVRKREFWKTYCRLTYEPQFAKKRRVCANLSWTEIASLNAVSFFRDVFPIIQWINPFQSNFFLPAYSPALIYFGREWGWWITCNYPITLKDKNINWNRKSTTCTICWLKSVLHEEKRRKQENYNVGLRPIFLM
jgi:hypothetical protein